MRIKTESPVRRVVVSPNDEITAFLLEVFRDGKRSLRVALYHTQDILEISMQRLDRHHTRRVMTLHLTIILGIGIPRSP